MRRLQLLAWAFGVIPAAAQTPEAFYEQNVLPVLRVNCLPCHSQQNRTSGLALDARSDVLSGGNRGPAVQVGDPNQSLLVGAIEHTADVKMPPGRKLSGDQIAAIRTWIQNGLVWTETTQTKRKGADHWSFQPVRQPALPEVKNSAWVRNPIDRFILSRLEKEGLPPSAEADRYTLLRRVSLDLTGLPPSPREIDEFLNDKSVDAFEKVVGRLLASPHYGERWGRHWLDLARYADSDGYTIDDPRQIWRYRDWVIDAINRDMPFDQFTIEQIAGDLLPSATTAQLIATGFHRNTPSNYEGGIDQEQYRVEAVADRVATTGSVWLGLTLGCARCHDHKFDPVTQKEFYQIFAYYNSTEAITKDAERNDHNRPRLELPDAGQVAARAAYQKEYEALSKEIEEYRKKMGITEPAVDADAAGGAAQESAARRDPGLAQLMTRMRALQRREPRVDYTLITRELAQPRETYIHLGGDFLRKGIRVSPAVPAWLTSKPMAGNRLDLAKWLVEPANPLTPRVTVNRMWQTLFGRGIVETPEDFGLAGAAPTHPGLIDWMAAEFVARGWSQKVMLRLIVTSAAYRQDSKDRPDIQQKDPYNYLLARQSRLRLEAEILRDAALITSGLLTRTIGGPSVFPPMPPGSMALTQVRKPWPTDYGPERYRRGMYTYAYRASLHPGLGLFDAPDAATSCTRRVRSNSPLQALTLLNDSAQIEFSVSLGNRILKEGGATDRQRLHYAFLLATGRPGRPAELEQLVAFLSNQRDSYRTKPSSARALLRNERAAKEAESVANVRPEGAQSPLGRADSMAMFEKAAMVKEAAAEALARRDHLSETEAAELAAWSVVSRVLLNLDDFMTRN